MFLLDNHALKYQKKLHQILHTTHFFIMKIPNKRVLQQIALNHSPYIDFKDFIKIYKKCTAEIYYVLVNDTTLPSDNALRFRKNILKISI